MISNPLSRASIVDQGVLSSRQDIDFVLDVILHGRTRGLD